jgi:ABC-type multidrug transport system permease subunit
MLKVASDAADTQRLLECLAQEAEQAGGKPGVSPFAAADAGHRRTASAASSQGGSEARQSIGKSPFESPASVPEGLPLPGTHRHRLSTGGSSDMSEVLGHTTAGGAGAAAPPQQHHRRRGKAPVGRQLSVLFWRTFIDIVRNPALLLLHSLIAAIMGLITGLVFLDSDFTNVGVQNRMGGTFFALAFLGFTSLTTVDLLINERQVVTREVRGGYYHPSAYLLSKLTLDAMLLRVLPAIWYFFTFYYLAGFRTSSAYAAAYCLVLVTFSCVVGAMSMSVTVASNTAGQASFAMNFLLLFSLVFTGFLVNVSSIPKALRWLHYLSVFYYAFEAMITGELNGQLYDFQAAGSTTIPNVPGETYLTTLGELTD